jgi:hypothetical protein
MTTRCNMGGHVDSCYQSIERGFEKCCAFLQDNDSWHGRCPTDTIATGCTIPTTCVPYESYESCTSCSVNSLAATCSDSASPYCAELWYPYDASSTLTQHTCWTTPYSSWAWTSTEASTSTSSSLSPPASTSAQASPPPSSAPPQPTNVPTELPSATAPGIPTSSAPAPGTGPIPTGAPNSHFKLISTNNTRLQHRSCGWRRCRWLCNCRHSHFLVLFKVEEEAKNETGRSEAFLFFK